MMELKRIMFKVAFEYQFFPPSSLIAPEMALQSDHKPGYELWFSYWWVEIMYSSLHWTSVSLTVKRGKYPPPWGLTGRFNQVARGKHHQACEKPSPSCSSWQSELFCNIVLDKYWGRGVLRIFVLFSLKIAHEHGLKIPQECLILIILKRRYSCLHSLKHFFI